VTSQRRGHSVALIDLSLFPFASPSLPSLFLFLSRERGRGEGVKVLVGEGVRGREGVGKGEGEYRWGRWGSMERNIIKGIRHGNKRENVYINT